jgi:hypothetical protein
VKLRSLSATVDRTAEPPQLTVRSEGVTRVDVYADMRPVLSLDLADGSTAAALPQIAAKAQKILLQGFDGGEIVVSATLSA